MCICIMSIYMLSLIPNKAIPYPGYPLFNLNGSSASTFGGQFDWFD